MKKISNTLLMFVFTAFLAVACDNPGDEILDELEKIQMESGTGDDEEEAVAPPKKKNEYNR